jgi:hypothetical protein
MLNNGAIAWKSRRQPSVALSTMESESMAPTEATKELYFTASHMEKQVIGKQSKHTNIDNRIRFHDQ